MKIVRKPLKWLKTRYERQVRYHKVYGGNKPNQTLDEMMDQYEAYYHYVVDAKKGNVERGWSFLPHKVIKGIEDSFTGWRKTYRAIVPRKDVIIIYRSPGAKVFVVDEPRLPLFSTLLHHHGSQEVSVDENYKCMRCGEEVPTSVKTIAMMEATIGVGINKKDENNG